MHASGQIQKVCWSISAQKTLYHRTALHAAIASLPKILDESTCVSSLSTQLTDSLLNGHSDPINFYCDDRFTADYSQWLSGTATSEFSCDAGEQKIWLQACNCCFAFWRVQAIVLHEGFAFQT